MIFVKNGKNEWWELNEKELTVFNYNGGCHKITKEELNSSDKVECESWTELYNITHFCPLEVNIRYKDVWISPNGLFYEGNAHENRAEEILEIMYNETDVAWYGDRLEELGWIRATTSLMWEIRLEPDFWINKKISKKQYDALWDWCKQHNKDFPNTVDIII